ncbi:hypothetical protein [Actinacidiphila alni]|uniref:hypothetical protein n=1 Tax=Actinacidiphila alni TaxID=380248 RepID=UPI0034572D6F
MKRIPPPERRAAAASWNLRRDRPPLDAGDAAAARERIAVPTVGGFPPGLGCDVVETSAEHGLRILDCLPSSGCVLARGRQWSWIVPTGSDIDVQWPPATRYLPDAAVLVSAYEPRAAGATHSLVHLPDQGVPYTHPILLYFAACCISGVQPAMTVE